MSFGAELEMLNRPVWVERASELMKEQKVSRDDLTDALEVKTVGAVGHYFTGRRDLSLAQAQNLSNKLNTSVAYLLGETDNPKFVSDTTAIQAGPLMQAFQLLCSSKGYDDKTTQIIYDVIEDITPENIVKVHNIIARAERSGNVGAALIDLESIRNKL
ncbi:helix-turn-helix domain-containing protein [Algicola sagamiensis]|uniref:helix-turn-helix domain-containing protein n=1 Tax=Algicola sagamiensis TaxID=163869 RepID=UPI0012FA2E0C|nr:hypothetical protein [Algicola sagamiensis]